MQSTLDEKVISLALRRALRSPQRKRHRSQRQIPRVLPRRLVEDAWWLCTEPRPRLIAARISANDNDFLSNPR
jgi:hypothetical protein